MSTTLHNTPVIVFEATDDAKQTERERRIQAAYRQLHQELQTTLREMGVAPLRSLPDQLLARLWMAYIDAAGHYERRTKQVERTLRTIVASDTVSDEQRARIFDVLYGRTKIGRDPKTLSADEATIVEHYRQQDAAGKQMIRTLVARLDTGYAR